MNGMKVIDNQHDTNQYLQHENLRLIFVKVNRGGQKRHHWTVHFQIVNSIKITSVVLERAS